MSKNMEELIRGILSRRDPEGYYVIPASPRAMSMLQGIRGVEVVETGDVILARTRSRRLAARIARMLARLGLLALL
ncbi:MAG: hypothetical protein ABWW69_02540 [Pyrodictiaceae archaeon]